MCNFTKLYYGETGYLLVCKDCEHYQLAFHTSLFSFTAKDLHVFHCLVKEKQETHSLDHQPHQKCIYIPTPLDGFGLILNPQELHQLYTLLEIAEVNYKAECLLHLFKAQ